MTLILERKKCVLCGKFYPWNPDVGKVYCLYCKALSFETKKNVAKDLIGEKMTTGLEE